MEIAKIAGILFIIWGVILLICTFLAYAKRKLTENFGLVWSFLALVFMAVGIVLAAAEHISTIVCVVSIVMAVFLVVCLFGISQVISVLTMKNQELAMQVSLLNQENETILKELLILRGQNPHGKEQSQHSICD